MPNEPTDAPLPNWRLREMKVGRKTFAQVPRRPITVVLGRVRQHYNLGAMVRLCDAFLVDRLAVTGAPLDMRKRKFVQAARGTARWVQMSLVDNAATVVGQARAAGSQIVVVEQRTMGAAPEAFATPFPVCLVLGSERDGVSHEIVAIADAAVTIPMLGMANSINVATAAAIALHTLAVLHDRVPE